MKKLLLILSTLIYMSASIKGQSYNLVVFCDEGIPFYVSVNGIRQNTSPETNVRVTGLNAQSISLKVEFEGNKIPTLKQNMALETDKEHTVRIKQNKKLEWKLQYFGSVALNDAQKGGTGDVAYHTADNPVESDQTYNTSDGGTTTNYSQQNTTSSTTTYTQTKNDNVSVNINLGGTSMNVNINGVQTDQPHTSTTTTMVSTTTTTRTSGANTTGSSGGNMQNAQVVQAKARCSAAMSEASFARMKQSIASKSFSEERMSTARLATKSNCLSVPQVKDICALFNMDDDKLNYAKYAYDYCVEKGNYYQVSEAFSFSTTTEQFNKFLETK